MIIKVLFFSLYVKKMGFYKMIKNFLNIQVFLDRYMHDTKKHRLYQLLLIGLFFTIKLFGQNHSDIYQVESYLEKVKEIMPKSLDSALLYVTKATELSKKIENDTLIIKSVLARTSIQCSQRKFQEADSTLQQLKAKSMPIHLQAKLLHNLGVIQQYQQEFEKALQLYLKEVELLLVNTKFKEQLASSYVNIGVINAQLGRLEPARDFLEKALKGTKNKIVKLQVLINLSNIYYNLKDFDIYVTNTLVAEKLAQDLGAKRFLAVIYTNLGRYYNSETTQYDQSINYLKKGLEIKKELGEQKLSAAYNNLGFSYLKKKEYKKSITYFDQAIANSTLLEKQNVYNNLKSAYQGLKDYKNALYYADKKDQIKDSLSKKAENEKVTELLEKYESEKKALEIEALNKEKEIQNQKISQARFRQSVLLSAIVLLVLILLLGVWAYRTLSNQRKELEAVNNVKNHLFSIIAHDLKGMIIPFQRSGKILSHHINKGNYERAVFLSNELGKNSQKLSNMLNNLLDWSLEQMNGYKLDPKSIEVGKELQEIVEAYREHALFKKVTIDLEYEKEESILFDTGAFHIVFRNLLANALKYTETGAVKIQFKRKQNQLLCMVKDTGIGMKEQQVKELFNFGKRTSTKGTQGELGTGLGLSLVYRFISMHNGTISVQSEYNVGTQYNISIPV